MNIKIYRLFHIFCFTLDHKTIQPPQTVIEIYCDKRLYALFWEEERSRVLLLPKLELFAQQVQDPTATSRVLPQRLFASVPFIQASPLDPLRVLYLAETPDALFDGAARSVGRSRQPPRSSNPQIRQFDARCVAVNREIFFNTIITSCPYYTRRFVCTQQNS